MNAISTITAESLTEVLEVEVPDTYVIIAKHRVLGMDTLAISDILGVEQADVDEVEENELYQRVKAILAVKHADMQAKQSLGWDDIESLAVEKLVERLPVEKDSEFLLRVAAVANKATRKQQKDSRVLDPSANNGTTAITLTQRLVRKITKHGDGAVEETRQISISDGSMEQCSFSDIDSMLAVSTQPVRTREVQAAQDSSKVSLTELSEHMEGIDK